MPNHLFKTLFTVTLVAFLMACGGGGDADADTVGLQDSQTSRPSGGAGSSGLGLTGVVDAEVPDIGMNLPMITYYDQSFAFADLARHASITNIANDAGTDRNNAPLDDFNLFFDSRVQAAGTYKLIFKGKAKLTIRGAGERENSITNQIYDSRANITTANVTIANVVRGNKWIAFSNTQRTADSAVGSGVTEIQFWRPGYEDGSRLLTNEFKKAMQRVRILRAMDAMVTNTNTESSWADRTPPTWIGRPLSDSTTGIIKGQAWETLILEANELKRDLWITIPVKASDSYIENVAKVFKYGSDGVNPYNSIQKNPKYPPLDPNLRLYIEWGNEIWNTAGAFKGYRWAVEMANEIGEDETHPTNYTRPRPLSGGPSFVIVNAWKSAVVSNIFRSVFGDGEMMVRIRPVYCNQVGNKNSRISGSLQWAEAYYGDNFGKRPKDIWYAGCDAPYYGSEQPSDSTAPATMTNWFDNMPPANYAENLRTTSTWLKGYGLKYITYEGGPEPGTASGTTAETVQAYNNDPRMALTMGRAYDQFKQAGGDNFIWYGYSGMGAPWVFNDPLSDDPYSAVNTVKMAFLASIPARPKVAVTLGSELAPVVELNISNTDIKRVGTPGSPATGINMRSTGSAILIPIRVDKAGLYRMKLNTKLNIANATPDGTLIGLWANGDYIGDFTPLSPSYGVASLSTSLDVKLEEGVTVFRLQGKTATVEHNVSEIHFEMIK